MEDETPHLSINTYSSARSATALRDLESRARAALAARREQMSRLESELAHQLDTIEEALAVDCAAEAGESVQAEALGGEIARLRDEMAHARSRESEFDSQRKKWESERTARDTEKSAWEAERLSLQADYSTLQVERDELAAERSTLQADRDELSAKLANACQQQAAAENAWTTQLADFEQKLHHVRNAGEVRRTEWDAAQLILETERNELKQSLAAALEELESTRASAIAAERDQLQQKFELALNDVQRFRSRAADLEQELARRPAANQIDSAELVSLRAERDALAGRIDELERAPKGQVDADTERQLADFQRRFELAVEDVRELKTKNAQLEAQLVGRKPKSSSPADSSGMDWESQKRRLLASLEDSGDDEDDDARRRDRVTIANTIEITDAVVAEKDCEISDLRAQLAASEGRTEIAQGRNDAAIDAIVDADEVVQQHRKRLAQLEQEMEQTLRTAELELSVERAKMARQQARLEDLRAELNQRESQIGGTPGVATPKRRWLSKLGLNGDDQS